LVVPTKIVAKAVVVPVATKRVLVSLTPCKPRWVTSAPMLTSVRRVAVVAAAAAVVAAADVVVADPV
jgi:hypothetical protein